VETKAAVSFMCGEADRQGANHYDIIAGDAESMGLDLFEGKIKNTEISTSRGIGIRLFVKNCPGYAFTEKYSKDAIQQTVSDAISHTKLTGQLEINLPKPATLPDIELNMWNQDLQDVTLDQMKDLGLELESFAKSKSNKVDNIPYLGVGRTSGTTILCNSNKTEYSVKGNSIYAGLGVVASLDKQKKMGVYSNSAREFDFFKAEDMASIAVERAVEMLGAKPVISGKYPVVLSNRISPQMFSMYSSPYYADVVQKGQSKLQNRLGEKIAVDSLNITCDPHLSNFPGSRLFDGEGVICQKTEIVKEGILKNLLYNLESSHKENRLSSGHASRDYSGQVGTGFSNMIIDQGSQSLEELMSIYPECLYVTQLEGGAGCSSISGEISIGAQGFWIKQGKKIHPVEGITISSNYFDLIKNIKGLSDQYSDIFSSVKVPDVLIESMYVAG